MAWFASDNTAPAHPKIMEALIRTNHGHARSYGGDAETMALKDEMGAVFGVSPDSVWPVFNGSACNGLALQAAIKGYESILAHEHSHIHHDECGLPEAFHGAKIIPLAGEFGKITPKACRYEIEKAIAHAPHTSRPRIISLTQSTELGTVYSKAELDAFSSLKSEFGMKIHMDGARLGNAIVSTGLTPRQMVENVEILSFGGTKAGALLAEAVVIFDPVINEDFAYRRKRMGQLASKMRFISVQMRALLKDNLWLELAQRANEKAAELKKALSSIDGAEILVPVEANEVFARIPKAIANSWLEAGHVFYPWPQCGPDAYRFVTSYATEISDIQSLVSTKVET
jgi:threonine aldolase